MEFGFGEGAFEGLRPLLGFGCGSFPISGVPRQWDIEFGGCLVKGL